MSRGGRFNRYRSRVTSICHNASVRIRLPSARLTTVIFHLCCFRLFLINAFQRCQLFSSISNEDRTSWQEWIFYFLPIPGFNLFGSFQIDDQWLSDIYALVAAHPLKNHFISQKFANHWKAERHCPNLRTLFKWF